MGFRILIADDEPLIRVDLKEVLEEQGYVVVGEAEDGSKALRLIEQLNPDVAILDIKMPGLDGLEVARLVSGHLPVIILTAYTERHLIQRAKEVGVMAYLSKPFREGDVSPAVELAVSHFLERSELTERVLRLREQLETRKLVERAKGILMSKKGINEPEAYRWIQKMSMDSNKTMREVAEAIIKSMD